MEERAIVDGAGDTGRHCFPLNGLVPDYAGFLALGGRYGRAMVTSEVPCDLETPVSAFMKLKDGAPCFLLESAEKGENWGRYSILGFAPGRMARIEGGRLLLADGVSEREVPGDPVRCLFEEIDSAGVFVPDGALPFSGGAVGYFGYDLLPYLEKVEITGPPTGLPEAMFMFPGRVVVFDHLRSRLHLAVETKVPRDEEGRRRAYVRAARDLADIVERLRSPLVSGLGRREVTGSGGDFEGVSANMTRGRYESIVRRAREHIFAGDAFQIVPSQKFSLPFEADPLSIYRCLRSENPSPYMFHLELPPLRLVGSSPESMVTQRGGRAVIRPIAGTRPRGADGEEDELLERELKADPKELAEHIMLVDLARNDLGRVCRAGTVSVSSLMEVERYSHVMHLVSQVEGTLKEGVGNYELLKASFPAGTVSGAPKVMACRIIDGLEPDRRGPYAGAVGYVSYTGDMDTCITIRTVAVRDGVATVQAGGGVVADSVPAREYMESKNKARALIRAVRAAGGGAP